MTQITVNLDVLERAVQALDTALACYEVGGGPATDDDGRQIRAAYDELVAIVHEHSEIEG